MRRFLLDTTPLAGFLQGRPDAVALVDPWLVRREVATSILVYGEIAEYLMGKPDFARRDAQIRSLLREIMPLHSNVFHVAALRGNPEATAPSLRARADRGHRHPCRRHGIGAWADACHDRFRPCPRPWVGGNTVG